MKVQPIWNENRGDERKAELQPLINYIEERRKDGKPINLIFICTHNSRRSQLAQVWSHYFSYSFAKKVSCFSGGTEITACDRRTIEVLKKSGFGIQLEKMGENPYYALSFGSKKVNLFSKLYDSKVNPSSGFAAVMTCSQADKNCPFIAGADCRISIPYDDPKQYDNQPDELRQYDKINRQVASEMWYVFSKLE